VPAFGQTIGYHVVPRVDYEVPFGKHFPLLAVLFCEDKLKFIFFPFVSQSGSPCIDAIVSPAISIFNTAAMVDHRWFSFICYYIQGLFTANVEFLTERDIWGANLHDKKYYGNKMEATDVQSRMEQLQLELEEQERNFRQVLEEWERENEELRRRLAEQGLFSLLY
jgi:hypothetical protein